MPQKRLHLVGCLIFGISVVLIPSRAKAQTAAGPLRVLASNPRYFTADGKTPVYLTGSHTWANLQDGGYRGVTPDFDYLRYLDFLEQYHHNFIRLWTWEHTSYSHGPLQHIRWEPTCFLRTGPGNALDGYPRYDLNAVNQAFLDRLRNRVAVAGQRGIYVSVMLFQGFSVSQKTNKRADPSKGNPWAGHPFNRANNINGIDGDPNGDQKGNEIHTLSIPTITRIQEAYVRRVIDAINDLDNVLWEIGNELDGASTEWQYHMIRFIKEYERGKPKQHPVLMTFQWDASDPGSNANLFDSPADAVSPRAEGREDYKFDPPPADGSKVILSDTDHLWGIGGSEVWVWKSFCRGLNPIFMDRYDDIGDSPLPKGIIDGRKKASKWEALRRAMGDTRRYAERMDLAAMTPQGALSSTGYCLANPGVEYLVFDPDGKPFTLDLSAASGRFNAEWFDVAAGEASTARPVAAGKKAQRFTPPRSFPRDAVLYLSRPATE
ncbi:MAG: DUF6298 domain-containing protein [Sedimentisphaerales bacterium]